MQVFPYQVRLMGRLQKWYHAHKKTMWLLRAFWKMVSTPLWWSGVNGDTVRGCCWRCSTLIYPNPFFFEKRKWNSRDKTTRRVGSSDRAPPDLSSIWAGARVKRRTCCQSRTMPPDNATKRKSQRKESTYHLSRLVQVPWEKM